MWSHRRQRILAGAAVLQLALAASLAATSVIPISDEELRDGAALIARGTVLSSYTVECEGGRTCTRSEISLLETYKGQPAGNSITILDVGGIRSDGSGFMMWGRPRYVPGREVIVFANVRGDGALQTAQMLLGKYDVMSDDSGHRYAVPELVSSARRDVEVLDRATRDEVPVSTSGPRFLSDFSSFLKGEAKSAPAMPAGYAYELRYVDLTPRNRLIEPDWQVAWNARWVFGTAQWKFDGTEAITEGRSALSTWTNHADSNINYVENAAASNTIHLGVSNTSACGGWSSCGGSGVVGCGGPSISGSTHNHRGESFSTIVGGEVWIRCGLSSMAVAEAVILHELGHTLGLGHSDQGQSAADVCTGDENGAVMRSSVSISNPKTSLQTDDRDAAKWLYGTGAMSCGSPTPTPTPTPGPTPTPTPSATPTPTPTPQTLSAKFSVSPTSGIATQTQFKFTDTSTGGPVAWAWSFGDGFTSNSHHPTHIYGQSGNYTVTLTITGSGGAQTSTSKVVSVSAPSANLQAAFSYSPDSPTTETTIEFVDQSSGFPTSWTWNFGDGTSSNAPNPQKRFNAPGVYTVALTVNSGLQSSGASRTITVAAGNPATPPAVADFQISDDTPPANEDVFFTDLSTGNPTSWSWSFGDGSTSSARNPAHRFTMPGTYNVSLIASNAAGPSGARVKTVTVSPVIERFQSLVPVTAQTSGVGSTYWRTELTVFNYGENTVTVDFRFVPGAGGTSMTRSMPLSAGGTLVFQNALPDLFGLGSGAGGVIVEAQSPGVAPKLRVSSRTFTGGNDGTYGQYVPDVETLPAVSYLAGIQSNANYRTNIGFVNRSGVDVPVSVSLYDADGALLGMMPLSIPSNNYQQQAITALFPLLAGQSRSGMSMMIQAAVPDAITAYASTIDNRSQDPIFYPAVALPATEQILIPGIARVPGAEGTFWRTDASFFNPTGSTMQLSVRFLASGRDNRAVGGKALAIGPGKSVTIEDVLTWMGSGDGSGALLVSAEGSGTAPIVTARTYTTRASDGGTYGQWIDASELASLRRNAAVTGIRSDEFYRTNVGFVNGGDQPLNVAAAVHGAFGQILGTAFVQVPPKSQVQVSLANLLPGINPATVGSFSIRAEGDASTLIAYASMIDNRSGDPIFVKGK